MIVALENRFETVRVILQTEFNDILVCRSLSRNDRSLYTLIKIKDKAYRERFLRFMSTLDQNTFEKGFLDRMVSENQLILIFPYQRENRLFYFKTLYQRSFSDRLTVAGALLYELMASKFPDELLFFVLEDTNLNLTGDKKVFFNYFIDISLLPEEVTREMIMQKASAVVFRILTEGMKSIPDELTLFKRKMSGNVFVSLSSIYAEVKKLPQKLRSEASFFARMLGSFKKTREKLANPVKIGFFVLLFCFSCYYTVTMIQKSRAVPTVAKTDVPVIYTGMNKIGTVVLAEDAEAKGDSAGKKE